jgi:hypothetical protein
MRRLLMVAAIAWLGASAWAAASLPPMGRVLVKSDHGATLLRIEAFTAAGDIVVSRVNVRSGTHTLRGPVTVHAAESGRLVGSGLTSDDQVVQVHWAGRLAVARRGQATLLVSLEDGKTLIEHPHAATARFRSGSLSPSGTRFLVEGGDGVLVWDVPQRRYLATFKDLRVPLFGDDNTFYAVRPVTPVQTPNGRIQSEGVRVDIDAGTITPDQRRPIYDCGGGLCSPSGEYGVSYLRQGPGDGLGVYHNGRMEVAWKLDLRRQSGVIPYLDYPGISFSHDSREVMLKYQAGEHAIGLARWRTSDGTPLTPLPEESKPVEGFSSVSPDGYWSARTVVRERLPKWIPQKAQGWLFNLLPQVMNNIAPSHRVEVIDNRWDRVAAVVPGQLGSVRFAPDSRAFLVDNQNEIVRYAVPSGRFLAWCLWGIGPAVVLIGLGRRRRRHIRGAAVLNSEDASLLGSAG